MARAPLPVSYIPTIPYDAKKRRKILRLYYMVIFADYSACLALLRLS